MPRSYWKYERMNERSFKPYSRHRKDKICTWIPNRDTKYRPPYHMLILIKRVYMAYAASPFSRPVCTSIQAYLADVLVKAGDLDHMPLEKISIFETVTKQYIFWRCEACNVKMKLEHHYVDRDERTFCVNFNSIEQAYRDPRSDLFKHLHSTFHKKNLSAYKKFEQKFIDYFNGLGVNGFFNYCITKFLEISV